MNLRSSKKKRKNTSKNNILFKTHLCSDDDDDYEQRQHTYVFCARLCLHDSREREREREREKKEEFFILYTSFFIFTNLFLRDRCDDHGTESVCVYVEILLFFSLFHYTY
jgi:hypothetical protein